MIFAGSYTSRFLRMNKEYLKSKIIYFFILLAAFLFIGTINFSCEKVQKENILELDSIPLNKILDQYVGDGIYPFIYSLIKDSNGKIIYEYSAINKKLLPDISIQEDTWMRIWSMSKLVTISIAMDLIEDGYISMEEPVAKYIPEFKDLKVAVNTDGVSLGKLKAGESACPIFLSENDSILKIKNLFNHSAGFYYALTGFECLDSLIKKVDVPNQKNSDSLIYRLSKIPLIQHSGEMYRYGLNTTVLGLVLERATGSSLNDLVIKKITRPYKIKGLKYSIPQGVSLIPCHTGRDGYLRQAPAGELDIFGKSVPEYSADKNLFLGGEGMLGTANGYIDFMRLLFFHSSKPNNEFLTKESINQMTSKPPGEENDDGYQTGYAFYLTSKTNPYEKNILRVGGYEGTTCWVDREHKLIGTLFTQANETSDKIGLGTKMHDDFKKELRRQLANYEQTF